ncbi:MAG TPA: hypothetical protein EYG86_09755 [Crocinitomicaceae bacterium]|nr:hypothetical protein [Crocinitomicaceae bacterium]
MAFKIVLIFILVHCRFLNAATVNDGDSSQLSSISFLGFHATAATKIIHFKWEVEKENKGDYFLIEKSIDDVNWKKVTQVKSLENHNERHTYTISEINFAEGAAEYFRIIRVDKYGEKEELDKIEINQPILTNMLLLPVKGKANKLMTLSYDSLICSDGKITVQNKEGEIVQEKLVHLSEGYNRITLNIKSFEGGHYLVLIKDEFENKVSKTLTVYRK